MSKRDKITNEQIIDTLWSSQGFVTVAAEKLGVCRASLYKWIKNDEELKAEIESIQESLLDFSESQLMKLIKNENPAAIFFHLKCKGKDRGYVERQETTGKDGLPLIPNRAEEMTDEELMAVVQERKDDNG